MSNMGFLRKELKEPLKTSRFIVVTAVFIFFAIFSALGAKYINEILKTIGGEVTIILPDPTYLDSWSQFIKNTGSICLIVFLLIMTGTVVSEKTRGSVMLVLSKGVSRLDFIFSKTVSGIALFTAAYILSAAVCAYYTYLLFGEYPAAGLTGALFLVWMMGVFYITFGILVSVLSKTATSAAIFGFAGYALFNIPTAFGRASVYTPAGLARISTDLLKGTADNADVILTAAVTASLIFIFSAASIFAFRRQEI